MKNKILLIGIIVLPALLSPAWAADIFGTWIANLPFSRVTIETIFSIESGSPIFSKELAGTIFSFETAGTRLTGTVFEPQGRFAISDGRIQGDKISFVVIHESAGKKFKVVYKGKVSLNEIQFTRKIHGSKMEPQEFVARREFLRHNDYIPRPIRVPVKPVPDRLHFHGE
jgi:hypothetical protein